MKAIHKILFSLPMLPLAMAANATVVTPDFTGAPTGWTTDRYAPSSFGDVGTYQGRNDVLGISISSADSAANRANGFNSSFYNTQGAGYAFSTLQGAGSVLSADLYIPATSANSANGAIRTDMWGVMNGSSSSAVDYPIIGFANTVNSPGYTSSTSGHFQVFDSNLNGGQGDWVILSTAVNYGAWNSLQISFTGSSYVYSINGATVYTDSTINGATGFAAQLMQAYNFGDPADYPGVNAANYTVDWSNTPNSPVPEASTYVAGLLMLLPFGGYAKRMFRKPAKA